jgi:hypothetical protein
MISHSDEHCSEVPLKSLNACRTKLIAGRLSGASDFTSRFFKRAYKNHLSAITQTKIFEVENVDNIHNFTLYSDHSFLKNLMKIHQ